MKGNNTLALCHAQVIEIIQHYFDTQMYQNGQAPTVTSIRHDDTQSILYVSVSERKPAKTESENK